MFLILAEVALFALLPFIQEPTATQPPRRYTQPAQSLLEHFFEQHYGHSNNDERAGTPAQLEQTVSPRSAAKMTFASSPRNTLLSSNPGSSPGIPKQPASAAPRMLDTTHHATERLVVGPRLSHNTAALPRLEPRESEDFVFAPSSGSNTRRMTNAGDMIFAPSTSRSACPQKCEEHETCFNYACHTLLKQGPCNPGEWLVENNGRAQCARSNCQYPQLPFEGRCLYEVELQEKICSPDQSIVLSRDGTFECDCTGRKIYDPRTARCYEAYDQGPCGRSQYFILTPDTRSISGSKPSCVRNPCREGMVCYGQGCPNQVNCVTVHTPCTKATGGTGVWSVHDQTKILTCEANAPAKSIGNVPTFSCGKGSKRDRTGKCRKVSSVDFS